jgi:hypothetical protein
MERGFTSKKLRKIKEENKMRKRRRVTVPVVTITLVAIALMISGLLVAATGKGNLISVKVTSTPKLDGSGSDAVWRDVPELKVQAKDGPEISLRSVYTSDSLYMLISWEDKTESVKKNMWVYDGTKWDRLKDLRVYEDKPTKADEDRLSIHWPINDSIEGFAEKGCLVICHDSGGFAKRESRMFTNSPTEFADQWHWKAARTNPLGYTDDKWMDNKVLTKAQEPNLHERREAAHHGDAKGEGKLNYSDNKTADGKKPKFRHKGELMGSSFLKKEDVTPIDYSKAAFKKGDTIPGYVLARPRGSRGDADARGVWRNGRWTLEIGRKLVTADKAHDAQFDDLKRTYHFGIAVFDNDGSNVHTRPLDPIALTFK